MKDPLYALEAIAQAVENPRTFRWEKMAEIEKILAQFNGAPAGAGSSNEHQPAKADNTGDGPAPAAAPEEGKEEEGEKMKIKVVVEWLVSAVVEVEADSIEQAIEDVAQRPDLPDDGEYVDGSWRVVEEFTYDENEE